MIDRLQIWNKHALIAMPCNNAYSE